MSQPADPFETAPETAPETRMPAPPDEPADRFAHWREMLDSVADRPLAEHAAVFAEVHTGLQSALAEVDGL